jgi:hypothetical protein
LTIFKDIDSISCMEITAPQQPVETVFPQSPGAPEQNGAAQAQSAALLEKIQSFFPSMSDNETPKSATNFAAEKTEQSNADRLVSKLVRSMFQVAYPNLGEVLARGKKYSLKEKAKALVKDTFIGGVTIGTGVLTAPLNIVGAGFPVAVLARELARNMLGAPKPNTT